MAANWSTGVVPTSADDVCAGDVAGGSYTVTVNGSVAAHSITVGGTLTGTQTLTVQGSGAGNGLLSLGAGTSVIKSNGALILDSTNGDYADVAGSTTLTNNGSFSTVQDAGGIRYIQIPLANGSGGTVTISSADTRVDTGTLTTNGGAFTVASSANLSLTAASSFTNSGGTLTVTGSFTESGGTFTESVGAEAGANPAVIVNVTMADSAGTGSFILEGTDTLSGSIPSGQTINVLGSASGNGATVLSGPVTNNGTLLLDSNNGDFAALETGTGGALDNKATLKTVDHQHGIRYFEVNITNEAGATTEIGTVDTRVDNANTITNKGTFTVDASFAIALTGGSSFTNSAGTLTVNGLFSEFGGTFTESGGNEAGTNPAVIVNAAMADSAGTGSFILEGSDTLSGNIPAGQTMTQMGSANGNSNVVLSGTVTNNGTMLFNSTNGDYTNFTTGTLDNKATMKTIQGAGGIRFFEAPIINEAGATIEIATLDNRQDNNTATTNSGTFTLDDGAHLTLSGGSTITETSSAVTGATIGATSGTSAISGGTITIAGTLQVTRVGSPALGNSYQPITATTLSGTFATLAYGTADYDTSYSSSAVTLVVAKPFVLTGKNVKATEDTPATKVAVATWTDDDQPANQVYTATINWGDSTQTSGTTSDTAGGGSVKGTHTYLASGTFFITTTVTDSDGTTLAVTSKATVHVAPVPGVTAVSPPTVVQGSSANLVVTGTGFTDDSAVSFSAAGITIDSVTFVKTTELKVTIDVAANATTGAGNVSVTTDGGTGTCIGCLTVDAPPKVTGASPSLPPGLTTTVTVTGSGFQTGLTATTSIPGATVGTPTSVSATSFMVAITVPGGTTAGTYKLTVTNPDGGKGSKSCLVVT